jgi:hypothetical protein
MKMISLITVKNNYNNNCDDDGHGDGNGGDDYDDKNDLNMH